MDFISGTVLGIYGELTAPIHELGHVIFGWLTLNPTVIAGWNLAMSSREGFIMSLGGYLFEIIFGAGLVFFLRRYKFVYAVGIFHIASALYATSYQGDFPDGSGELFAARIIWSLAGVIGYIVILCSAILVQLEKETELKQAEVRAHQAALRARQADVYCRPGSNLQRRAAIARSALQENRY
jgi:hypothetical protein